MLHLFNYGNNASSINAGFDFDNSTINPSYYSKTSDNCGMFFYGPSNNRQYASLKKTNNTGKKYIEILYGTENVNVGGPRNKVVVQLRPSVFYEDDYSIGTLTFVFMLYENIFYRGIKPTDSTSVTFTQLDYSVSGGFAYNVVALAIDFDLGHLYVGYVRYTNISTTVNSNNYSLIWVNDPSSGVPTYTFPPNTDMRLWVNPSHMSDDPILSTIYVYENSYSCRVDPPAGYSYWNDNYSVKQKSTFSTGLNRNTNLNTSTATIASGTQIWMPFINTTKNFTRLYYEMVVVGDITQLMYNRISSLHSYEKASIQKSR